MSEEQEVSPSVVSVIKENPFEASLTIAFAALVVGGAIGWLEKYVDDPRLTKVVEAPNDYLRDLVDLILDLF